MGQTVEIKASLMPWEDGKTYVVGFEESTLVIFEDMGVPSWGPTGLRHMVSDSIGLT